MTPDGSYLLIRGLEADAAPTNSSFDFFNNKRAEVGVDQHQSSAADHRHQHPNVGITPPRNPQNLVTAFINLTIVEALEDERKRI